MAIIWVGTGRFETVITPPPVVTNGLIVNLDAGNSASYPGSGTTWFNTVGSNNGTLTNGPTFSTAGGGGIVFDGANDFVNFATPPSVTNQITLEAWASLTPAAGYRMLLGRELSYRVIYRAEDFQFVVATTNNGWYSGTVVQPAVALSGLVQVVCTYNGSRLFAYVNGNLVGQLAQPISGNLLTQNNYSLMGSTASGAVAYSPGIMFINRVYNRALSDAEVFQNFQAVRDRFGV
jgi:hypothetical protein